MANLGSFYSQWSPRVLSVLRIVTAFLFMQHGGQKLFGFPAPPAGNASSALADWGSRNAGIFRGSAPAPRIVQQASSLSAVRANGSSLLHGPFAARVLAFTEQRGAGGHVLLRVSIPVRSRRRQLELRPSVVAGRWLTQLRQGLDPKGKGFLPEKRIYHRRGQGRRENLIGDISPSPAGPG